MTKSLTTGPFSTANKLQTRKHLWLGQQCAGFMTWGGPVGDLPLNKKLIMSIDLRLDVCVCSGTPFVDLINSVFYTESLKSNLKIRHSD